MSSAHTGRVADLLAGLTGLLGEPATPSSVLRWLGVSSTLESLWPLEGGEEVYAVGDLPASLRCGIAALNRIPDGPFTPEDVAGLEAIVRVVGRPALLVQQDRIEELPVPWTGWRGRHQDLIHVTRSVGRVEVSGLRDLDWLGTAFLVNKDTALTNRHVAEVFTYLGSNSGDLIPGIEATINFGRFVSGGEAPVARIERVKMSRTQDVAVLRLAEPILELPGLKLATSSRVMSGRPAFTVGYPAWDGRRNDPLVADRVFRGLYGVKRVQPGFLTEVKSDVIEHDCSTLGGNSGSPLIDTESLEVVGIHFSGRYLQKNLAVPAEDAVAEFGLGTGPS